MRLIENNLCIINTILLNILFSSPILANNDRCTVFDDNNDNTGIKGICKNISQCTGDYIHLPGLCDGDNNTRCCVKRNKNDENDVTLKNFTNEQIIENLKSKLQYNPSIKNNLIEVAKDLLESDQNYDPKFIAGILGNIACEGTPGYFESSWYSSDTIPCYLQCMNDNFNYLHDYSGKTLSDIGVNEVIDLMEKVNNKTVIRTLSFEVTASSADKKCYYLKDGIKHYKYKHDTCTPKFGLGMIQWTGSRTDELIHEYNNYKNVSPDHKLYITDYPTIEKCRGIESNFMLLELKDENKEFRKIVKKWEKYKTPYYAGFRICNDYENPAKADQRDFRGKVANDIFKAMKGCCKANKLYCHKKDVSIKSLSYKNITDISNSVNTVDNEACNCDSYDSNTDYEPQPDVETDTFYEEQEDTNPVFYDDTHNDDEEKYNDDYINDNHHYQDHDQDQKEDDKNDKGKISDNNLNNSEIENINEIINSLGYMVNTVVENVKSSININYNKNEVTYVTPKDGGIWISINAKSSDHLVSAYYHPTKYHYTRTVGKYDPGRFYAAPGEWAIAVTDRKEKGNKTFFNVSNCSGSDSCDKDLNDDKIDHWMSGSIKSNHFSFFSIFIILTSIFIWQSHIIF